MTEPQRGPAWLVLPTYNEAANIEPFVAAARSNLPADARILIVDDGSPDGTGERADRLAERHAEVSVLHRRTKEGLGPAYIAGFRRALASGAGLVLEMDSDFSHDPRDLPRVLRWFTANIGIHHVHHLCSRIPYYRLPRVLRDHPELGQIGRLTLRESLSCVRLALWDERRQRLVSFREAARSA